MTLLEELVEYSESVLDGKEAACVKHKWACQRFLDDLTRQNSESFPYYFCEKSAQRFLDWLSSFKHRKGVLAGQYIDPHIIQKFVFGNIYGWKKTANDMRRFRKGYWQVARKNAKSQSLGGVGSFESAALGEPSAEVYCAATKKKQSKIVWNEIEGMIRGNEYLRDKFRTAYGIITHLKSDSFIEALSKEDGKDGDGTNPQCGIIDEYHLHETDEMYEVIESGMGARPQPLMMIITTAGLDLNKPCYRVEYKYVSRILDPDDPTENEEYFVMINELDPDDDVKDEKNWPKANPILCTYEAGLDYLRSRLKVALDEPEKMHKFMTKNMNVWMDAKEHGYMQMNKFVNARCEPYDLKKYPVWVGIDLSMTTDLTSIGKVFKVSDTKYIVQQHSFIPEDRLQERIKTDKAPFDLWEKQGYLTTTPGAVVDYSFVEQHILQMREDGYNIQELNPDKWNATHLSQRMEREGFTNVEIPQTITHLSLPTKDFRKEVYAGNLQHFGDPLLEWAMRNAVTKTDPQENIMLDKAKSTDRIDPAAASINAFSRAQYGEIEHINVEEFAEEDFLNSLWS